MAESEDQDNDSKSEAPTEQKLRRAREQGDVPNSREMGTLMSVAGLCAVVLFVLPHAAPPIGATLAGLFDAAGQIRIGTGPAGLADINELVLGIARGLAVPVLSMLGVMVLAGAVAVILQGETVVAVERIRPKLSKLSPLAGLKRIFSLEGLVEFVKSVAKVLIVGVIALWIARRAVLGVWRGPGVPPEDLGGYLIHYAGVALISTCAFLLPLALGDAIWKRFSWLKRQRMSMTELKEERRESEGDPLMKGKRLQIGRRRAKQRAAQAVPKATLILTNPTHFAVALRYDQAVDVAPVCVAKGTDLMARRIREIAMEHDIPIIENRPLARLLHTEVEVDQVVPMEHWQAVAEIVGYVIDLRRNIRRRPPPGSELRSEA